MILAIWVGLFAASLAGCGVEPEISPSESGSSIALPKGLDPRKLPSGVTAMAIIPELGAKVTLVMNNEKAIGSFSALPAGKYTVIVRFSSNGFILAQSEQHIDYHGSSQIIDFSGVEYEYPDDDGDKYSNLTELLMQKNPAEKSDKPVPRRVFITSVEGPADLSKWSDAGGKQGILAGDAICQARADSAGLNATFRAWLSDDNNDAYCRVAGLSGKKGSETCKTESVDSGLYVRTDDFPFAKSLGQLIEGEVLSAIQFDEAAQDLTRVSLSVWTGTAPDGALNTSSESNRCDNWASDDSNKTIVNGKGHKTALRWTSAQVTRCGDSSSLYCFQVSTGDSVDPLFKLKNAKKVFVTSSTGSGDLSSWASANGQSGVLAGEQICQTLASKAGFKNADRFSPWLSDSTDVAINRLQGEGPWARPDGLVIATDKADLLDGNLMTSIVQTEQGNYISDDVWTGTNPSGRCKDCVLMTCDNWISASPDQSAILGRTHDTNNEWTDTGITRACDKERRLYCFEGG
jgi:hypothetical protein